MFHLTVVKEKKKHVIAIKTYSLRCVARFDPDSYCLTAKFPPKNAVFNRKYVFLAAAIFFVVVVLPKRNTFPDDWHPRSFLLTSGREPSFPQASMRSQERRLEVRNRKIWYKSAQPFTD